MIIVTGGAGFIGSAVVWELNRRGESDILIVDRLGHAQKWKNLVNLSFSNFIDRDDFLDLLRRDSLPQRPRAIIHMGACSSTTETNADFLIQNNLHYSQEVCNYAVKAGIRLINASSAATYGAGAQGFSDEQSGLPCLRPLNMYGYSKHLFDLWTVREHLEQKIVSLKFFNVYGPNEYAKGNMASVIFHGFKQIQEKGKIGLFESYKKEYEDGEQLRDFVYVKDVISVIEYFIDDVKYNGIYNVGTGKAESFNTLAKSIFHALNIEERIEYIEMPETLRDKYQYFTEADITKLRSIGYTKEFYNLTEGAKDYVTNYLVKDMKIN